MKPNNLAELAATLNLHKDVQLKEQKDFRPIPSGHYTVMVDKVYWDESKNTGTPCIVWHLKIAEGAHEGRMLFKRSWLKPGNSTNFEMLAQDLKLILGEVPELTDPQLLNRLLDKVLFVRKRDRADNDYDIFFNGIDRRVEPENPEPAATFADDDIPF